MIFKFDKSGNMENMRMEGDIDMGRKSNKDKDKFQQVDVSLVNQVKEEVMSEMSEAQTQVAVGFESLNDDEEDMVQQHEMELVKEMESESDKIWDKGSRDGVVGASGENKDDGDSESNKGVMSDEELKEKMRERNMGNVVNFNSLEEKYKSEDEQILANKLRKSEKEREMGGEKDDDDGKEQMKSEEKEEKQRQKDIRKFKKEFKDREKQLKLKKESNDKSWSFDNCLVTTRDGGVPFKYQLSLSALQLAEMYSVTNQIFYDESTQRGEKVTKSKGNIPLVNIAHSKKFLKAVLEDSEVDGGTIYLNYAKENPTPLRYDQITNTLSAQFPLSVNDGAHRLESCVMWYKLFKRDILEVKNPDDFYFSVTILNMTQEQSENVFVALNSLGLPVSKTRIAFHDTYNQNNVIAKKVMNNSFLRGRIELVSNSLKKTSNCVMTFNTLSKGCSMMSPETPSQVEEVGSFLCSYFNEIVEIFPKIFGNVSPEVRHEERTKIFIGEVMFVNSLFSLAKEIQGMDDWKERLKRLAQKDFLSRDNPTFRFCLREGSKLINSSKVQKDIASIMLAKVLE